MSTVPSYQGVGMSWECASSGHGNCHQAGCRCVCHYRPVTTPGNGIDRVSVPIEKIPTPPHDATSAPSPRTLVCPKCGQPGREGDKFCRRDGTEIPMKQYCGGCGTQVDLSDLYCANCGAPTSGEITTKSAQ